MNNQPKFMLSCGNCEYGVTIGITETSKVCPICKSENKQLVDLDALQTLSEKFDRW